MSEFFERAGVPHLYCTASRGPSLAADLGRFLYRVPRSGFTVSRGFFEYMPSTWDAVLRLTAAELPTDRVTVIVLDELPSLIANDPGLPDVLRAVFDDEISRRPVLLAGIGSDLETMEALTKPGGPFHQRAAELAIPPLNPADVAEMLELPAAEAIDAYLVSGGMPMVLDEWPAGTSTMDFLAEALADPTSALIVNGERALAAEFPIGSRIRRLLGATVRGMRLSPRAHEAEGVPRDSLVEELNRLVAKRIVEVETPLSTQPSSERRYWLVDPYLRFWFTFVGPHLPDLERGLSLFGELEGPSWRASAVEPVVRESLRLLPHGYLPFGTRAVSRYWPRVHHPVIEIVGADSAPVAETITLVGAINWSDRPFGRHDLDRLVRHRDQLPGADASTPLLAVSRTGSATVDGVRVLGPEDLLAAYRSG